MKRSGELCVVLLLILLITTGCWNLREPNEVAFVLGGALDLTKDGQLETSVQIAIPSGLGGGQQDSGGTKKKSFRVISATGKDVYDTTPNLQAQLSRSLFIGHRQIILVGQRLAEHGVGNLLDEIIRNPQTEMRSRIYVVKGGQAKDILSTEPIFDPFSSTTLVRVQAAMGLKPYYFRNFVSDALNQGLQPMLPAIRLTPSKQFAYAGAAMFNKDEGLKLVGFLNNEEASYANWITNRQASFSVTSFVTQDHGNVSIKLQSLSRRIRVKMVDKQMKFDVYLTGEGTIVENNTNLDPTKLKDLHVIQDELSRTTQKSIQQIIEKVQKQYRTDIFGFGEMVHQQYPYKWRTMKRDWNDTFPRLNVSVKVDLQCTDPGETNSAVKSTP